MIKILHLYPKEMNLYGDHGNVLVLKRRLEWRGIKCSVVEHEPGDMLPSDVDIIFGGGGQDSGQTRIEADLKKIGPQVKKMVEAGVPTLVVCGMYQLFGKYFETMEGHKIEGIGVLNLHTKAGKKRLIGNIVTETEFGEVVGYENHSGLTYLGEGVQAFGKVEKGGGNNGRDGGEGARYKNCIGTYLHGPVLPKNPAVADFLIKTALERQGRDVKLPRLDDDLEKMAHKVAAERPRV